MSATRSGGSETADGRAGSRCASVRAPSAERSLPLSGAGYGASSARCADAAAAVELGLLAAELGHGLLAVHPLARDAVPVGARAKLREHGQREHLHAPAEQVLWT